MSGDEHDDSTSRTASGITCDQAIVFAEKDGYRALELDVYRPAGDERVRPLLHYVHGGGWRVSHRTRAPRETRAWTPTFFERMVAAGFVVVASDYRFSGEAPYPAAVDDTADALRWARDHADELRIDPTRTVLFGQSAGGYLAAAVGLGTEVDPVQGIVCWYPLTDFSGIDADDPAADFPSQWLGARLDAVPELVEASRVPRLARADAPPVLLQHGTADSMAPYDQSVRLHDSLAAVGALVTLEPHEGADHFFVGASDDEVHRIFERAMAFAQSCT